MRVEQERPIRFDLFVCDVLQDLQDQQRGGDK